ncbi:MAG: DUF2892 domain-containing protein, partial [Phyllobacteriaceae bacterium]|nr:DUF2892 domain-containing protein [Phyllobacteriaceae bacterium]
MGNIRTFDRFLRLVLGIAALQLGYFWLASPWSWLAYAVALVLFVTAAFRFCPLYRVLGIAPVAAGKTIGGLGLAT